MNSMDFGYQTRTFYMIWQTAQALFQKRQQQNSNAEHGKKVNYIEQFFNSKILTDSIRGEQRIFLVPCAGVILSLLVSISLLSLEQNPLIMMSIEMICLTITIAYFRYKWPSTWHSIVIDIIFVVSNILVSKLRLLEVKLNHFVFLLQFQDVLNSSEVISIRCLCFIHIWIIFSTDFAEYVNQLL